jgi:SAM-dependent MidA family methyltransferase
METLASHGDKVSWHESFDGVPDGFTLLAANELFDAIPIRQFVKTPNGFRERMVGIDENNELCFTLGVATLDPSMLPQGINAPADGEIFEVAPARQSVMLTICERLNAHHGTALVIDYGHMVTNFGDTLQAVRAHEYDPPLAHPGLADLTSHVDFENLARTALAAGVYLNGCMHQGDFLVGLGIEQRAASLGRDKGEKAQAAILDAVHRLAGAGKGHMGELFKVMAVSSPPVLLLPFKPKH